MACAGAGGPVEISEAEFLAGGVTGAHAGELFAGGTLDYADRNGSGCLQPAVAPLHEGYQDRDQVFAHFAQTVALAASVNTQWRLDEYAGLDQFRETVG